MTTYYATLRGLVTGIVLAVLAITGAFAAPPAAMCITVEAEDPARVVASMPLEPGQLFWLEFINSIYLAPVKETYRYDPREGIRAILVESPSAGVFEYYGLVADGSGTAKVNTKSREIRVRSHDYRNHRLSTAARSLSFKGLVPDGEPLIIRVREGDWCGRRAESPEGKR